MRPPPIRESVRMQRLRSRWSARHLQVRVEPRLLEERVHLRHAVETNGPGDRSFYSSNATDNLDLFCFFPRDASHRAAPTLARVRMYDPAARRQGIDGMLAGQPVGQHASSARVGYHVPSAPPLQLDMKSNQVLVLAILLQLSNAPVPAVEHACPCPRTRSLFALFSWSPPVTINILSSSIGNLQLQPGPSCVKSLADIESQICATGTAWGLLQGKPVWVLTAYFCFRSDLFLSSHLVALSLPSRSLSFTLQTTLLSLPLSLAQQCPSSLCDVESFPDAAWCNTFFSGRQNAGMLANKLPSRFVSLVFAIDGQPPCVLLSLRGLVLGWRQRLHSSGRRLCCGALVEILSVHALRKGAHPA